MIKRKAPNQKPTIPWASTLVKAVVIIMIKYSYWINYSKGNRNVNINRQGADSDLYSRVSIRQVNWAL